MQNKPLALVIDDEADLCRLMQITLNKMGVDTHIAYDVATAKDFLAQNYYDFCLTDLALPDGSGMDIVQMVAKNTTTPVAVITAHGDVNTAIEAMKIGAFDFVNKPLDLPRLRQLAQSALKVNSISKDSMVGDNNTKEYAEKPDISTPSSAGTSPLPKVAPKSSQTTHSYTSSLPASAPKRTAPQPTFAGNEDIFDGRLIGDSRPMKQLRATIKKLARSQAPVFLWGGSGTGKEVVSRLIHDLSGRRDGNFVPVNCGAIPSELMESEFFGHKKGSFTGATSDKMGLFQQADGGTLFLDEVADLPLAMQVKLLRAIQEKTVRAIGDTKEIPVDIRIVCATHKDLAALVQQGAFRQDLYYRINVIEVKLPTLNDRRDDIPMLANHFLDLIAKDWGLDGLTLTDDAIDALTYHNFKGNVRELRNILERAVTLSDSDEIDAHHLMLDDVHVELEHLDGLVEDIEDVPHEATTTEEVLPSKRIDVSPTKTSPYQDQRPTYHTHAIKTEHKDSNKGIKPTAQGLHISGSANYGMPISTPSAKHEPDKPSKIPHEALGELPKEGLEAYLLEQERQLIYTALQQSGGNKTQAAKLLGMTFRSLRYRMKKLEIDDDDEALQ